MLALRRVDRNNNDEGSVVKGSARDIQDALKVNSFQVISSHIYAL